MKIYLKIYLITVNIYFYKIKIKSYKIIKFPLEIFAIDFKF